MTQDYLDTLSRQHGMAVRSTDCPIPYDDLIGMPYTREHDCNWLAAEIFRRFGQPYPDVTTPRDSADWPEVFQRTVMRYGRAVTNITPGTLMTFCFREPDPDKGKGAFRWDWHMGVMVTRTKMITTTARMGVHIINRVPESPLEAMWWAHFRGAYLPHKPDGGPRD